MISQIDMKKEQAKGFTLLELLIVVGIIAILSVALIIVLNPAETLRKARDSSRISDLNTLKTALGLYMTSTSTPFLGPSSTNALNNTWCKAVPTTARGSDGLAKIWYSTPTTITDLSLDDSNTATPMVVTSAANAPLTSGAGWIPVNFDTLIGGSPISHIPIDPVNNLVAGISTNAIVRSEGLAYRYSCSVTPLAFEINANLESISYTSLGVTDDKEATDGGNSSIYYEVGTNLLIFGAGGSVTLDF